MKGFKNKRGISLIVLVITIIVMIILAAAIILSISNSGIIEKANMAKEDSNKASAKEIISVAHSEWLLMTESEKSSNGASFATYAENKLQEKGYKAEDYIIQETGEAELCVAKIGETKYASLQDAINVSSDDNKVNITIINNLNLDSSVGVENDQYIVLDLNGYTITNNGNVITNNGVLVIKDSSENKTGRIKGISPKEKYKEKYDFNKDGIVGQLDIDEIVENINAKITEDTSDEIKKLDINGDNNVNIQDILVLAGNYTDAYAVFNSENGILTLKDIVNNQLNGEPSSIYNKKGTVTGYNVE